MIRRGIAGTFGLTTGAVLAAALIPVMAAAPARAACVAEDVTPACDTDLAINPTNLAPFGEFTSISDPSDGFTGSEWNFGTFTNDFFVGSEPALGLGQSGVIEDVLVNNTTGASTILFEFPNIFAGGL
ncbi:MAG: hypothetical protein J2P16_05270 [Mycobacterium sp.]|nr:hypothetical protein [Mycobacterium sp.]